MCPGTHRGALNRRVADFESAPQLERKPLGGTRPQPTVLRAPRLDLVPMTLALAEAELRGVPTLAAVLGVPAPDAWPPDFYDGADLNRMRRLLQDPVNEGWALYYLVHRGPPRALVGVAGYAGRPTVAGEVEIGYGILPRHRGLGLATEAVSALVAHAFQEASVERVVAETFPHLSGSIGVLARNRFQLISTSGRGGGLRYELHRSTYQAGAA